MGKKKEPNKVDLSEEQVEDLKKKIKENNLSEHERELLANVLQGFVWLSKMLQAKKLSMRKLARLFGIKTEKQKKNPDKKPPKSNDKGLKKSSGGRNGKDDYTGAKKVFHEHEELSSGDRCPGCKRGNLYEIRPGSFINIVGAPPLEATVHEVQKFRCATCGMIYTAQTPEDLRKQKFDETADVAIALMKYGTGVPFYRQEQWQKMMGVPIPSSTAWDRVEHLATSIYPVYEALIKHAAQCDVSLIDDTTARITLLKKQLQEDDEERKGLFTTGVVAKAEGRVINLFMTGNRHAGENLDRLLEERSKDLNPMIRMSDALSSNNPKVGIILECLCLTHARRNFIDAKAEGPSECQYIIDQIGKIYHYDKLAKSRGLNDVQRRDYHAKKSGLVLRKLRRKLLKKFALKKIEPNSPLGEAIQYLFKHWKGLTEFLRTPGAPIDNNRVEQLLKRSILHRKNSLFFRTQLGAYVGDVIMSLIETCRAIGTNPFSYLVALHRNKSSVHKNPEKFLPWIYG